jgi:hypothetical protein
MIKSESSNLIFEDFSNPEIETSVSKIEEKVFSEIEFKVSANFEEMILMGTT